MVAASIVGASGYAGGELLRLLLGHPRFRVKQVTSETWAGKPVHFVHPNLRGCTDLRFVRLEDLEPCDFLFLALPHGQAMYNIDSFSSLAPYIVDLSADFRLRKASDYPRWYGLEHPAPHWLSLFVYGLPELHREEIRSARYVSGVGCNAACSILALYPLYRRKLVEKAIVDVKVGSSEGGSKPTQASHHPERAGVMRPYAPASHRHLAELLQELNFGEEPQIHFTVTSVDAVRGALATCHCFLKEPLSEKELWKIYREDYADEPFIRLVSAKQGIHRYPDPKVLAGSNYCDIGFAPEEGTNRVVVMSAIDNLMKGSAGNALQAANLMLGFPETMGLEFPGLHPV